MSNILIQSNNRTITRLTRVVGVISSELEAAYLPDEIRDALQTSMGYFQRRVANVEAINAKLAPAVAETPVQA